MKKISDYPAVVEAREKLSPVTDELAKVERERQQLLAREVDTARDDIATKALKFLSGQGIDDRPKIDTRMKRLGELAQRGKILVAAQEIAVAELAVAEQAASAEIMEAAGAEIKRLAQDFATSFSEAALKAKAFKDFRDELEEGGVSLSSRYPAIALGRLDIRERDSWVNRVLTDLENDYGAALDRKVLEAQERDVEKVNAAEAKRSQMAGNGYGAGPKGIFRWLPGGKKQVLHTPDDVYHGGALIRTRA